MVMMMVMMMMMMMMMIITTTTTTVTITVIIMTRKGTIRESPSRTLKCLGAVVCKKRCTSL